MPNPCAQLTPHLTPQVAKSRNTTVALTFWTHNFCLENKKERNRSASAFHIRTYSISTTMASAGPQQQGPPPGNQFQIPPGQKPTPEQIQAMQRQLAIDAEKNGMTVPEFIETLKKQAMQQQQMAQQRAQQGMQPGAQPQQGQPQQGQPQPIQPGPPKPEALAVANFLKNQDLKPRTCILNGQRKDMFKGETFFANVALPI